MTIESLGLTVRQAAVAGAIGIMLAVLTDRYPRRRGTMTAMADGITSTDAYAACEKGIRRIHALIDAGRDDDEETDRIRQEVADIWHTLPHVQQKTLRQLSQSFNDARNAKG